MTFRYILAVSDEKVCHLMTHHARKTALAQLTGSTTATASQAEIAGLTRGVQYWFRVRAIRASRRGPWSDVATRVANV